MRRGFSSKKNHQVKYPHYAQRIPRHLLHEQSGTHRAQRSQQTNPARHLPRLLLRRQDWRTRAQRRGQIHVTAHHGGRGQRLHRRNIHEQGLHRRTARAGT